MRRKGLSCALAFAMLFTSVPVNTVVAFSDGSAAFEADAFSDGSEGETSNGQDSKAAAIEDTLTEAADFASEQQEETGLLVPEENDFQDLNETQNENSVEIPELLYAKSLLPVALSLETGPQNTINVEGSDIDLHGLRVKVRYKDGSEKSVDCQSGSEEDGFGNSIFVEMYGVDENGNLDRENYCPLYEVSPGIYYLDVSIWSDSNVIYLDNPVRIEVKSKMELAVEIPQTGEMTDLDVVSGFAYAKFTPQADGYYILESRTDAELRVYDALGEELSYFGSVPFESRVWLTAGQTYLIQLSSYFSGLGRAGMSITQEPSYEASLSVQQSEITVSSGRQWFTQAGLTLLLTHEGETVKLVGSNVESYGYTVRIVDKSTGEVWDEYALYEDLKPGTYEITAVRKTEGGIILSASLPVEITVKEISYDTLPELTENEEMLLPASSERQALRFKPSRSGFYTVSGVSPSEIYPLSNLSATVKDGYLKQGETYIFWFPRITDRRLISISQAEEKVLAAGAEERIDVREGQQKYFLFTPAETGDYVLHLENEVENVQGKIEIPDMNISTDDSTYVGQFTEGKTYRIYTKGADGCPYVFSIHKPKAIQSAEAVSTSDTLYEEFSEYYYNIFTIRITYTDGTTAQVKAGETNLYGSSFRYASSWSNPDSVTDNQGTVLRSWTINVYDAAQKKYIDTIAQAVYQKDTTGVPELMTGVPLKITYEGQLLIFRFTPETSGKYVLGYDIMTMMSRYWQNGVYIYDGYYEAGQPVYIYIWPENVFKGDVCTFTMESASDSSGKEVMGITLQKAADPVLPIQNTPSGMKAEVSYTDGTTAIISSEDSNDGYGNIIGTGIRFVAGNKARVYIQCGSYRASCIVDMADIETLPELGIGTEMKFPLHANSSYIYAAFRPQETGSYGFSVTPSTRYTNITVYDSEMSISQYAPAVMEAGKTYVLKISVGSFRGTEVSVTAYRADEDICAQGHKPVKDAAVAPTCTTAGKTEGSHCSVCRMVLTAQQPIAALGHKFTTVTTKATVKANGSVVTKCTRCKSLGTSTVIPYPSSVTLSASSYTYNGKNRKPTVKVKGSDGKTIAKSNYTVTYPKTTKSVGQYSVKITFKGEKYSGAITRTMKILPKTTSISKKSAKSKGFKLTWKKMTTQTNGYQIQYSTSSKFTAKTTKSKLITKNKITSYTVSKLKAQKTYFVRIRTYRTVKINGRSTKFYSAWSKTTSVKTKK